MLVALSIVAGAGLSIMFWSLVPAAVADCEAAAPGADYAGRVYALANIARKLAQAIAPAVIAGALANPGLSVMAANAGMTLGALATAILLYGREAGSHPRSSPE
jgi:glycoside/pentoside/hexuronide:cation symporter, GPH family